MKDTETKRKMKRLACDRCSVTVHYLPWVIVYIFPILKGRISVTVINKYMKITPNHQLWDIPKNRYFICFKVKICSKLKSKAHSFKEKADLNEKKMNIMLSPAWNDDSEYWTAGPVTLTVQSMAALCRGRCNFPWLIEWPFYALENSWELLWRNTCKPKFKRKRKIQVC